MPVSTLFESNLKSLPFLHRGKVRDLYAVGDDKLLVIQTDRLSAFDVILPTPVPGKGRVLTALSHFWFGRTSDIVNPSTGEAYAQAPISGPRDIDAAYSAASAAFSTARANRTRSESPASPTSVCSSTAARGSRTR